MTVYIISAVSLILGAAVSVINFIITKKALQNTDGVSRLMAVSMLRMLICIALIIAVVFVCKALKADVVLPLIAVGLGVSVPALILAFSAGGKTKK